MKTVGFIGTGHMGSALIKGLSGNPDFSLVGFDASEDKLAALARELPGLKAVQSPRELAHEADCIVLCVKPHQIPQVLEAIDPELVREKCLVSIAAGVTSTRIRDLTDHLCPVVRVMPNTPALVGGGVFGVCLEDDDLTQEQMDFVLGLFQSLGRTYVLPESRFDAFTALAGSGPAYVMYVMEALIEAGVYLGFARELATDIVTELMKGSAKLVDETSQHPGLLREMVTSPAGTTIEALLHLDRNAVRATIMEAVIAARDRSLELGQ